MRRVSVYVRVSTLEQAEHGYSVAEQEARARAFCDAKGWHVVAVYLDAGHSGATRERPGLTAMLANLSGIDVVLVYKLDRLSRSQKDTLALIEDEFLARGIDFVSVNETFDTSTPFGKAVLGMLSVFAELERAQIRERMTTGKVGRMKNGKTSSWSKAPFGYIYGSKKHGGDGRLELDPLRAPIVRDIIDAYLGGESIAAICNRLNAEGHVGKPTQWHHKTVREMLAAPVYAGLTPFKGELYEGEHPALITRETWETLLAELKRRQEAAAHKTGVARPFQSKHLLSGLLFCAACGERMALIQRYRPLNPDGSRVKAYQCIGQIGQRSGVRRAKNGCTAPKPRLDVLEAAVLEQIEELRTNPDMLTEAAPSRDTSSERAAVEAELAALAGNLERLARLYVGGVLPWESLEAQKTEIESARAALTARLAELDADAPGFTVADARGVLAGALGDVRSMPHEKQHALLRHLVTRIDVHAEKSVVTWRFT